MEKGKEKLTELESLFPESVTVPVQIKEKDGTKKDIEIVVTPLTIVQISRIMKAVRAIVAAGDTNLLIQELLMDHPEEVITIVSVAIDQPETFYGSLRADMGLTVAQAVFEVNVPFFVNVVAPLFANLVAGMMKMAGGLMPSSASSSTATENPGTTLT